MALIHQDARILRLLLKEIKETSLLLVVQHRRQAITPAPGAARSSKQLLSGKLPLMFYRHVLRKGQHPDLVGFLIECMTAPAVRMDGVFRQLQVHQVNKR